MISLISFIAGTIHLRIKLYIYICVCVCVCRVGGVREPALVILLLRECICNGPAVSLVLPLFDDTGSLGSPPHQVVYLPWFHPG